MCVRKRKVMSDRAGIAWSIFQAFNFTACLHAKELTAKNYLKNLFPSCATLAHLDFY